MVLVRYCGSGVTPSRVHGPRWATLAQAKFILARYWWTEWLEMKFQYAAHARETSRLWHSKALMTHARAHAKAAGAVRLLLGVYAGNAAAIGFYTRHGFTYLNDRKFNVGGREYDDQMLGLALGI